MGPPASLPYQERSTWSPPGIGPRNLNMIDTDRIADNNVNMREAVDNSRNRRIWRSLVEALSSANA